MIEQTPGTFLDEDGTVVEAGATRGPSLEERCKTKSNAIKARLTPERINASLPTEHLRKAFSGIKAATLSIANLSALGKKEDVLKIRERSLIDEGVFADAPLVYLGSGVDVEYPLTLGARDIIMVDPIFEEKRYLEDLRRRIESLVGECSVESDRSLIFQFDFGHGPERVRVKPDPRPYEDRERRGTESASEEGKSGASFFPPEKIAMLLAFQGPDVTKDRKTFERLVPGGYIFSNRDPLPYIWKAIETDSTLCDRFTNGEVKEKRRIIDEINRKNGFEPIDLSEDDYLSTFVRKQTRSSTSV